MTFETFSIIWIITSIAIAVVVLIALAGTLDDDRRLWQGTAVAVFLLVSMIVVATVTGKTKDNGERREIEALGYTVVEVDTRFNYVVIDHGGRYLSCDWTEVAGRFFVEPLPECRSADYGPKVKVVDE